MKIKNLIDEDFINYRKPSMFIAAPSCSFKCDEECGECICQNSTLAAEPDIKMDDNEIIERYLQNPITKAIVIGGLEPFDTFNEIYSFIMDFRDKTKDDIVIYTGYYPEEIPSYLEKLSYFKNIIIKFGRFIPNRPHKFDELLGIELASDNQWSEKLEEL